MNKVPNTIAILAGEVVAGRALELLLRSVGYETRFLAEPPLDEVSGLLDGVQLLILAPTVSETYRDSFLRNMECTLALRKIPVLELVTSEESPRPLGRGRVLWPCRIQDLRREIETALLIGTGIPDTGSDHCPDPLMDAGTA